MRRLESAVLPSSHSTLSWQGSTFSSEKRIYFNHWKRLSLLDNFIQRLTNIKRFVFSQICSFCSREDDRNSVEMTAILITPLLVQFLSYCSFVADGAEQRVNIFSFQFDQNKNNGWGAELTRVWGLRTKTWHSENPEGVHSPALCVPTW